MRAERSIAFPGVLLCCILTLGASRLSAQVENVPVGHPVYIFLDRMETRNLLSAYHDAVLPVSRKDVARMLGGIDGSSLTSVEAGILEDYRREFRFDAEGLPIDGYSSLIAPADSVSFSLWRHFSGDHERYLFAGADSSVSLFFNGLLTMDTRFIRGDAIGDESAAFVQFGGRFRGTAFGRLGYYLQGTNAAFWGSRALLARDPVLNQAHTLGVLDTKHFDFAEGYVRYQDDIFSAQIGRERLLWGLGRDQQLVASANVRVYDFIRAGARYKSFQYTFLHAWILGESSSLHFTVPGDTTTYVEPTNADKYFAGHRFEFTFPDVIDIGFQETVVYGNRSPDLAYLNPLIVIESAQRSRGERDNVYWTFDLETHFLSGAQLSGSLLFDDIHLSEFFEPKWYNRYAYQVGLFLTDPLFFPNLNLIAEYTRVEPYVFSHNRSREGSYSSLGSILGPRIGPNADAWYFRLDWYAARRLFVSLSGSLERSGENVIDASGNLLRNVGGDIRFPHRPADPEERRFLDGIRIDRHAVEAEASWEFIHQTWLEGWYLYELVRNLSEGGRQEDHTWGVRVRTEF